MVALVVARASPIGFAGPYRCPVDAGWPSYVSRFPSHCLMRCGPLTSTGLRLTALWNCVSVGHRLFLHPFNSHFSFFFVLFLVRQEKGRKRRAPFGTGPFFPRIAEMEKTYDVALPAPQAIQNDIAERNNAEKLSRHRCCILRHVKVRASRPHNRLAISQRTPAGSLL